MVMLAPTGRLKSRPSRLRSSVRSAMPARAGVAGRADGDRAAVDADLARARHAAVDAGEDLAAAGAEEAGEADDLAGGDAEADVAGRRRRRRGGRRR